jgi:hypothetical protein
VLCECAFSEQKEELLNMRCAVAMAIEASTTPQASYEKE